MRYRNKSKIDFNIRKTTKKEKEKLSKRNKLNIFPQFPSIFNNVKNITEGSFVQAPWREGKDKNYQGKYNGYVTEVYSNKKTCKVLFSDNTSCDVKIKDIIISEKICPYCNSYSFCNYNEYQDHIINCKNYF